MRFVSVGSDSGCDFVLQNQIIAWPSLISTRSCDSRPVVRGAKPGVLGLGAQPLAGDDPHGQPFWDLSS